jgi:hypothetical protein
MTSERAGKFGKEKRQHFLKCLREGMRRGMACEAVGISRWGLHKYYTRHPEFLDEIDKAELDACELVEAALFQAAISGNVVACQVWLYNRNSKRWMDKRNLAVSGEIKGDGSGQLVINVISAIARPVEIVDAKVRELPSGIDTTARPAIPADAEAATRP